MINRRDTNDWQKLTAIPSARGKKGTGEDSDKAQRGRQKPTPADCRIGEAGNPGHIGHKDCSMVTINVATSPTGSYHTVEDWVLGSRQDVIILQETRLNKAQGAAAIQRAKRQGWGMHCEEAVLLDTGYMSAGVAVLIKDNVKSRRIPWKDDEHRGKIIHVAADLNSGKATHTLGIYGYVGDRDMVAKNALLHESVLGTARDLGATNWVVGGDWNVELQDVDRAGDAFGLEWHVPRSMGTFATCASATRRIDFWVCSDAFRGIAKPEVREPADIVQSHCPIVLVLQKFAKPQKEPRLWKPGRVEQVFKVEVHATRERTGDTWRQVVASKDIDQMWKWWTVDAEASLGNDNEHFVKGRGRKKVIKDEHPR